MGAGLWAVLALLPDFASVEKAALPPFFGDFFQVAKTVNVPWEKNRVD